MTAVTGHPVELSPAVKLAMSSAVGLKNAAERPVQDHSMYTVHSALVETSLPL